MPFSPIDLFIRSAVILGSAEILRRCFRRFGAAERHQLAFSALLLLSLWPLLWGVVPELRLPLLPSTHPDASVTVEQGPISLASPGAATHSIGWLPLLWAGGFLCSICSLIRGYVRLHSLARKATAFDDPAFLELSTDLRGALGIASVPQLLRASDSVIPCTFGWWKPRILLPFECLRWSDATRRVVLLHELAHIKRRDALTRLVANCIAAFWWFQPLSWTSCWILRRESERAADDLVLASGIRPSDYATELLEIAQSFRRTDRLDGMAVAIFRPSELESRLSAILRPSCVRNGRRGSGAAILALVMLTGGASAITISSPQPDPKGGSVMKRTLFSGFLTAATVSAATIGGSLFDPSGAAVSNATASIYNPDTSLKQETTTSSDGKFDFESLPAGQYILHIEKPGFAALFREFNVQADSKVERGLVLTLSSQTPDAAHPAVAEPTNPQQIRVRGSIAEGNLIAKVQPVYPPSAKQARLQGTVELEVSISADGVPEDIRVLSSPGDDLTQSALDAVRQWRYKPTLLNGQPVPIITDVIVHYTLSQ